MVAIYCNDQIDLGRLLPCLDYDNQFIVVSGQRADHSFHTEGFSVYQFTILKVLRFVNKFAMCDGLKKIWWKVPVLARHAQEGTGRMCISDFVSSSDQGMIQSTSHGWKVVSVASYISMQNVCQPAIWCIDPRHIRILRRKFSCFNFLDHAELEDLQSFPQHESLFVYLTLQEMFR